MNKNKNLHNAKKTKNDEFYTQLEDIEKELVNYKEQLKDKIVYCNCDDYRISNFVKYFKDNFNTIGIKKLYSTNYNNGNGTYKYEFDGKKENILKLQGNGDFRSEECIEFLKEADVVVTNPPFSIFREYIAQLMEYNKKFLIMSNGNAITYKEFFPYIKENKVWLGITLFTGKMPFFKVPDDYPLDNSRFEYRADGLYKQVNSIAWFTNIPNDTKRSVLTIFKKYKGHEKDYPEYDNYKAIDCTRIANLPIDLPVGTVVGVPITALKYLCSDGYLHFDDGQCCQQFEIEKFRKGDDGKDLGFIKKKIRTSEYLSNISSNGVRQVYRREQISEQENVYRRNRDICSNTYQAYKIVWTSDRGGDGKIEYLKKEWNKTFDSCFINGEKKYKRILIQRIK